MSAKKREAAQEADPTTQEDSPRKKQDIHKDHRKRLRGTFISHGLSPLSDYQALELLLFYAIPRRDTNPLAHKLIDDVFGSLDAVLDATPEELILRGGLSENAAVLISLVRELDHRPKDRRPAIRPQKLNTIEKCAKYLLKKFQGAEEEQVYVLALDAQCMLLSCQNLFTGGFQAAAVCVRDVAAFALEQKAFSVIIAHNHPSGIATPSREDIETTQILSNSLAGVGVILADHLVIAGSQYVSMRERDFLPAPQL